MIRFNFFSRMKATGKKAILLAGILAGGMSVFVLDAQSTTPRPWRPNPSAGKAGRFYALFWGIDSPSVKAVEGGELIRFTYNVLDPDKAKAINDKKNEAYLIFPEARIRLSVPSLEKVGQLRQSSTPEAGKTYWMAFSNPGRRVKRGDRVNVEIGVFHADGLVVE